MYWPGSAGQGQVMVRWLWCSPVGPPLYFADFAVLLFSHVLHDFAHLSELSVLNDGGESTIHSGTQSDDLQWKFRSGESSGAGAELTEIALSQVQFPSLIQVGDILCHWCHAGAMLL